MWSRLFDNLPCDRVGQRTCIVVSHASPLFVLLLLLSNHDHDLSWKEWTTFRISTPAVHHNTRLCRSKVLVVVLGSLHFWSTARLPETSWWFGHWVLLFPNGVTSHTTWRLVCKWFSATLVIGWNSTKYIGKRQICESRVGFLPRWVLGHSWVPCTFRNRTFPKCWRSKAVTLPTS